MEIPETSFDNYEALVKRSMSRGFWNEIVGPNDIFFIFKHKDDVKDIMLKHYNKLVERKA